MQIRNLFLRNLLLLKLFYLTLLSGCTLLDRTEDIINISPLPMIENQFNPSILWHSTAGGGIGNFYSNLHPIFSGNIVYVADRIGTVRAFNIDDGQEVWAINLAEKRGWFSHIPALLSGGVAVEGGHVYVSSEKARVYSLNASNGSIVWKSRVAGEALSCPVISNGIVLIHTSNGQLQALNEIDGSVKWTVNLDSLSFSLRGESAPAVMFGIAIVGCDDGGVSAISIQKGQIIWKQHISKTTGLTEADRLYDVDISPVIIDGIVYAVAYGGKLSALDMQSGQIIWQRKFGSVNDFIINENRIYLVDQDDRLLALSAKNGRTLWMQNDLLYRLLTAPALCNGNLVVGDSKGYLHWVDLETGYFLAQQKVDRSGFLTKPIVANNKLLIQAKNGKLYAILP